jgi:hypothetical protein
MISAASEFLTYFPEYKNLYEIASLAYSRLSLFLDKMLAHENLQEVFSA